VVRTSPPTGFRPNSFELNSVNGTAFRCALDLAFHDRTWEIAASKFCPDFPKKIVLD